MQQGAIMTAFFAIALLCTASLTNAMSTITRIDSSLNDIAPSSGRVLQGGSFVSDSALETAVRTNDGGVPMGGGLVGDILLARFGSPHVRRHVFTQVSSDGRVTRTTQTTSVGGGAGVPGSPGGATLRRTETTATGQETVDFTTRFMEATLPVFSIFSKIFFILFLGTATWGTRMAATAPVTSLAIVLAYLSGYGAGHSSGYGFESNKHFAYPGFGGYAYTG
ncbi:hypothetical protein MRX96_047337 [Rhipicephalus microplus]